MDSVKTRILPVYVLSMQRPGRPPLIDGEDLFAATKDAVVVLQHGDEVAVPYFAGTSQMHLKAANPSSAILAGILTALGSVAPPTKHYSQHHQKTMTDLLFAHGWNPFGPFGNHMQLSQVFVDQAVRNAVLWRVDSAIEEGHRVLLQLDEFASRYLFDPLGEMAEKSKPNSRWLDAFGDERKVVPSLAHSAATNTMRQVHGAMLELEEDLASVSQLLYSAHIKDAFHKADVCLQKAIDLNVSAKRQLYAAENALACCTLSHNVIPRVDSVDYVRAMLVGIIAISGVVLLTLRDPERRRRIRAVAGSRMGHSLEKRSMD